MKRTPLDKPLDKFFGLFVRINKSSTTDQIFYTMIGRLILFFMLSIIPTALISTWNWMYVFTLILLIYPIQLTLIMIAYAWVINPINNFKNDRLWKRKKDERITLIEKGITQLTVQYPEDVAGDTLFLHFATHYYERYNFGEWNTAYAIPGYEFQNLKVSYTPFKLTDIPIRSTIVLSYDNVRKVGNKK